MTHRDEEERRRHASYLQSEMIGMNERLRTVEAQLAETNRRLNVIEREIMYPQTLGQTALPGMF
jgi:septal ring factor EnvC (AmiA/AmiB activator)